MNYKHRIEASFEEKKGVSPEVISNKVDESKYLLTGAINENRLTMSQLRIKLDELKAKSPIDVKALVQTQSDYESYGRGMKIMEDLMIELFPEEQPEAKANYPDKELV